MRDSWPREICEVMVLRQFSTVNLLINNFKLEQQTKVISRQCVHIFIRLLTNLAQFFDFVATFANNTARLTLMNQHSNLVVRRTLHSHNPHNSFSSSNENLWLQNEQIKWLGKNLLQGLLLFILYFPVLLFVPSFSCPFPITLLVHSQ